MYQTCNAFLAGQHAYRVLPVILVLVAVSKKIVVLRTGVSKWHHANIPPIFYVLAMSDHSRKIFVSLKNYLLRTLLPHPLLLLEPRPPRLSQNLHPNLVRAHTNYQAYHLSTKSSHCL